MKTGMNLEKLEGVFRAKLRPLEPDPTFVNHLRSRFNRTREVMLEPNVTYRRVGIMAGLLAAAVGIFTFWLVRNIKS